MIRAILILSLLVFGFLHSAFANLFVKPKAAWDNQNHPRRMEFNYERRLKKLPLSANLTKKPWSGDYWATYKGGITYRWNARNIKEDSERYAYPLVNINDINNMNIYELSPAEKYDLFLGRYDFPLTKYERKRTRVMRTVPWSDQYDKDFKIPKWEGLCHAWAPATILYENPEPVKLTNADGIEIEFGSSDIKALLTYHLHYHDRSNSGFLGSRCNFDFAEIEKKYKAGEMSLEEAKKFIDSRECNDTNAGAFHVVLTNQIALMNEGFVVDVTRDAEVWNQGVYAYRSKILSTQYNVSDDAAKGTVKQTTVQTIMYYIVEVSHSWKKSMPSYAVTYKNYEYVLDLDKHGLIIGGSWNSFDRPDFLWKRDLTPFSGFFKGLKDIYSQSIKYIKLDPIKNKIKRAARKARIRKEFINKTKSEVYKSKIRSIGRIGLIRKEFIDDVSSRIRRRKMEHASRLEKIKRNFINYLSNEVKVTNMAKFSMRNLGVNRFVENSRSEARQRKMAETAMKNLRRDQFIKNDLSEVRKRKVAEAAMKNLRRDQFIKNDLSEVRKRKVAEAAMKNLRVNRFVENVRSEALQRKVADTSAVNLRRQRFIDKTKEKVRIRKERNKALLAAVSRGDVRELVRKYREGGELTAVDENGNNALMLAASYRRINILKHLLRIREVKANKNAVNNKGRNALTLAIIGHGGFPGITSYQIVILLVQHGINVNQRDTYRLYPRDYARRHMNVRSVSFRNKSWKIDRFLRKYGARSR